MAFVNALLKDTILKTLLNFILILISFFCFTGEAQNSFEVLQLKDDSNKAQSVNYAIKQDAEGNLWIATEEGVLKHNSLYYKSYTNYKGLPKNIKNRILEIFIDSKQNIWIAHENGVCLYNRDLDVFEAIKTKNNQPIKLIKTIKEDLNGTLWLGSFNGLYKIEKTADYFTITKKVDKHSINSVLPINNLIYLGTDQGFYVYNSTENSIKSLNGHLEKTPVFGLNKINQSIYVGYKNGLLFKLSNSVLEQIDFDSQNKAPIYDLTEDINGNIYLATDGNGLYYLNNQFKVLEQYKENVNNPSALASNGVYDVEIGKENIVWLATYGGGINYLNTNQNQFKKLTHIINSKNSLASDFTRAIEADANSNYWFGTKKGISILNPKTNNWEHIKKFPRKNEAVRDIVLALEKDENNIWVGTYNNGLFKVNINTLEIKSYNDIYPDKNIISKIYTIHKDSKSNLWLGGIEGDLTVIKNNNSIVNFNTGAIKYIHEARDGNIYAVGRKGVFYINLETEELKNIYEVSSLNPELTFATINAFYEKINGDLILATNGDGLLFFSNDTKKITKLKKISGMPSDIVQGLLAQSDNNIWASTTKGLANLKLNTKDTTITVYDKNEGLASTEYNFGSFKKLNDSVFAFGGIKGVTLFNPLKIIENQYQPKISFTDFKLFNESVDFGGNVLKKHINQSDQITLKSNQNSIQIEFTGVSHSTNSKLKYLYQLEGFNKTWTKASSQNIATYTNLNSGEYLFKVNTQNKFGVLGMERQLKITILTPWWKSNMAIFMYLLLALGLIFTIIHFGSILLNKKNAEEQIDFFNNITHEIKTPLAILISSLDNLTKSATSNDQTKTQIQATVKRINSLFEQMLNFHRISSQDQLTNHITTIDLEPHVDAIINDFKPLLDEKQIKLTYTNKWKGDFFFNDKDLIDKVLLNIISNAIKYSNLGGKINIVTYKTSANELKIELSDNGIGIPKDQQKFILKRYYRARNVINSQRPGTGLGLVMVKRLLEKCGGSISFISEENKGTTFNITIKNLKKEFEVNNVSKEQALNEFTNDVDVIENIDEFSDNQILIVEDNDELRELLVNTLGVYFQIHEATNGKEGLEKASTVYPNLILTDLIMPEMDGLEMSKKIKDDINLNHIPVFMLSVLQNSVQKLESIESGISEYIEKPVDIKLLLAKIINTLKWQKNLQKKYIHDKETDTASLFRNQKDKDFLEKLEVTIIENIQDKDFSVHNLSKSFGMSRTSLYMKLKNLVDLSPQDFMIHTKLTHAKNLLIQGDKSIKEVAYNSGFSNPKYFSTSFKKFYGMSPSNFLDSLQKE